MAKESRARAAMGGKKSSSKKSKHKVHKMHVSRGPAGGFTAQHEMEPSDDGAGMPGGMSDPHPINDMAALQQHLQDHMGDQPPAAAPAPAASPAATAAGPAGM